MLFSSSGCMRAWQCEKAERCSPARWHSMTVDVRMGTTCLGKWTMSAETLISMCAAP